MNFLLPSIIITITSNEPMNHRNTQSGSKSTNHKPWPFEPVKFYFLRDRLRWLTVVKNAIYNVNNVSWLLNFRIRMFLKSAAILLILKHWDCFPSPVAINDKDGHGLKLENLGQLFQFLIPWLQKCHPKISWFVLPVDEIGLIHVSSS